jgi:integrase
MEYAGIQKTDERGRVLDVHAFRMTFCTNMAAAGIPLQTAQVAMRHSDPKLKANIYTDIDLLDVRGAMNSLPELSMDEIEKQDELATEEGGSASE